MCFATNKATVLVGVIFGSFAALLMPASCSLLSKHTPAYEQVLLLSWNELINYIISYTAPA